MVYSNTRFRSNTDIFNNIGETSIFLLYSCFCQFYTHIWKWDFFSSKFIKITFFFKIFWNSKLWKCIFWIWCNRHIFLQCTIYRVSLKTWHWEATWKSPLIFILYFTSMILFQNLGFIWEFRPYFNLEIN